MADHGDDSDQENRSPTASISVQADPEEKVRQAWRKYEYSKKVKGPWRGRADRAWKLYYGRHWDDQDSSDSRSSRPVIPKSRSMVDTRLAHLTTNRPRLRAFPYRPAHAQMADVATRILDGIYDAQAIQAKRSLAIKHCLVTGVGWIKVGWDSDLLDGRGDVTVDAIDEYSILLDPEATSELDAMWIIHAQNISLNKLRWWFREEKEILAKLEEVTKGPRDASLTVQRHDLAAQGEGYDYSGPTALDADKTTGMNPLGPTEPNAEGFDAEMVSLLEIWEKEPESGKIRITLIANNELLQERDSPFEDEDFPFVSYRIYPDLKQTYSGGVIEIGEGMQLEINKTEAQKTDILRTSARPIMLIPVESGLDPKSIRVEPGAVFTYEGGAEARPSWLQPGSMPAELFTHGQLLSQLYDQMLGNVDILQGIRPVGAESGRALNILGEKATVRLDREAMWFEDSDSRLGRLMWSRVKDFYKDERVIRTIGPDGLADFMTINAFDENNPGRLVNEIKAELELDIRMELAPQLPTNRQANLQIAMALAQAGAFGPVGVFNPVLMEELLKASYWPNWKAVMQKVTDMMKQMAEAQEKAGAQPPPQGQGA